MGSKNTMSRSIEIGLHFIGVWPGTPYPRLCKFFWSTTLFTFISFECWYLIDHFSAEKLSQLIDGLTTALPYSLLFFKCIMFWTNQSVLHDILIAMTRDCQEHADFDSNDSISRTAHLSRRLSNTIIASYSLCVVLYAIGFLMSQSEETSVGSRELLLKMELPFKSNTSPIYELIIVAQFLHQLASSTSVGILIALLLTMILHVGCQIDIICRKLIEISPRDTKQLKFVIGRHQEIISFVRNIKRLFASIALAQFISNTLITCCLGFLILISIGTDDGPATLVKSFLFYVAIALEVFIFCFAGEYLTTKSRMVGHAAYESLWYDFNPEENRILLILILRTQRELTITIGNFCPLSLEHFTSIMKASASYASVLLAMY